MEKQRHPISARVAPVAGAPGEYARDGFHASLRCLQRQSEEQLTGRTLVIQVFHLLHLLHLSYTIFALKQKQAAQPAELQERTRWVQSKSVGACCLRQ